MIKLSKNFYYNINEFLIEKLLTQMNNWKQRTRTVFRSTLGPKSYVMLFFY